MGDISTDSTVAQFIHASSSMESQLKPAFVSVGKQHKWGTSTKVGSAFPSVNVDIGFLGLDPNNQHNTADLVKDKKILWVTLPGAFTPT